MQPRETMLCRAARWLSFASAVSVLVSIAASQILLALAFAALLASGERLRLPRIKWPLAAFMAGTLISLAFSGEPAAGLPQVRKFFVFLQLLVVYSTLRDMRVVRWLFLSWAGIGALISVRGFLQFAAKVREASALGRDTYEYYVGERITGFTSHWNTYAGELMLALIMTGALLLFAPRVRRPWLWWVCSVLISVAVLLSWTRGVWIALAVAAVYLVWSWKPWMVSLAPLVVVVAFFASPASVQTRITSIYKPKAIDSNQFRVVTWRTGIRMIQAHPIWGLGPEGVKNHFDEYIPSDVPRPLPDGWYGHLHNVYLHYAAERGIPTMLAFVWFLIQCIVDFWHGLRRLPTGRGDRRFVLHGAIAVVIAAMVEGVVELNLGDSEVLAMFLVVVAAGYFALETHEETAEAAEPRQ